MPLSRDQEQRKCKCALRVESGGRALLQCSQVGRSSSIVSLDGKAIDVVCRHSWSLCSLGVSVVTVKAVARSGSMGRIS